MGFEVTSLIMSIPFHSKLCRILSAMVYLKVESCIVSYTDPQVAPDEIETKSSSTTFMTVLPTLVARQKYIGGATCFITAYPQRLMQ